MLKIRYAAQADADLRGIFDYTFNTWGLDQADRYTALILQAVARLAQSPTLLGRPRPELAAGIRAYHAQQHVIVFRFTDQFLDVARILHARMDLTAHRIE